MQLVRGRKIVPALHLARETASSGMPATRVTSSGSALQASLRWLGLCHTDACPVLCGWPGGGRVPSSLHLSQSQRRRQWPACPCLRRSLQRGNGDLRLGGPWHRGSLVRPSSDGLAPRSVAGGSRESIAQPRLRFTVRTFHGISGIRSTDWGLPNRPGGVSCSIGDAVSHVVD